MKHSTPTLASLAAALVLACSGGPDLTGGPGRAALGEVAPDVAWTSLHMDAGDTLADLRGRVVLLDFWRTW